MKTLNKIFTSTILLAAIILTGCFPGLELPSFETVYSDNTEIPAGMGTVRISIAGTEARTLFPDMTLLTYSAVFTNDKGDKETFNLNTNEIPVMLTIGTWTLNIEAQNSEGITVGEATVDDVEVEEGETTTVNDILIRPVRIENGEGILEGTLIWNIKFPNGLDEVMLYTGNNDGISIKNAPVVDEWRSGEINLSPGSYLVRAVLTKDSKSAGNAEAVHIFSGMETLLEWEFNVDFEEEPDPEPDPDLIFEWSFAKNGAPLSGDWIQSNDNVTLSGSGIHSSVKARVIGSNAVVSVDDKGIYIDASAQTARLVIGSNSTTATSGTVHDLNADFDFLSTGRNIKVTVGYEIDVPGAASRNLLLLVNNNTSNVSNATSSPINNGTNSNASRIGQSSTTIAFTSGQTGTLEGTLDMASIVSIIPGRNTLENAFVNIVAYGESGSNTGNKFWITSIKIEYEGEPIIPPTNIDITNPPEDLAIDLNSASPTLQLNLNLTPSDADTRWVHWSSSTAVVTVDQNGLVTGVGVGNAVITARYNDSVYNEVTVNVTSDDVKTLYLTAEAGTGSAYDLIGQNGFRYESPSQNNGSVGNALLNQPQITQIWDDILGKNVFRFNMIYDTARNATGDWTRQRLEVLVDHTSSSIGNDFVGLPGANEGRSLIHRWKFKLPVDFAVSGEFTHLHQIKNEGGSDAGNPIITLTARTVGSTDRMQLIYRAPNNNGSSPVLYLSNTGAHGAGNAPLLSDFRGHWLQVEETITYSSNPAEAAFSIKITRVDNGATLLEYTHTNERYAQLEGNSGQWPFVTWRTGNTHGRPKFGLYRRINTGDSPGQNTEPNPATVVSGLKDETILFADFEIIRVE